MRATGESASEHRSQTTVPSARVRVVSFIYLVPDVTEAPLAVPTIRTRGLCPRVRLK